MSPSAAASTTGKRATRATAKKKAGGRARKSKRPVKSNANWDLRLYVAGESDRTRRAVANLKKLCEAHVPKGYTIEVIDLMKNPALARGDQIVAVPTLVRKLPVPIRKIIGDLSNEDHVLVGLDLRPRKRS